MTKFQGVGMFTIQDMGCQVIGKVVLKDCFLQICSHNTVHAYTSTITLHIHMYYSGRTRILKRDKSF